MEHKAIGSTADGEHTPIITKDLFNTVQERLRDNSNGKSGKKQSCTQFIIGQNIHRGWD